MKTASCKTYNFDDGTYTSNEDIHRDMLNLTDRLNALRGSLIDRGYLTNQEKIAYSVIERGIRHGEIIMSGRRVCKKLMLKLGAKV